MYSNYKYILTAIAVPLVGLAIGLIVLKFGPRILSSKAPTVPVPVPVVASSTAPTASTSIPTTTAPSSDSVYSGPRDVVLGNKNAPVSLIIYGDYQCPYCAQFVATTERSIRQELVPQNKVKLVFRSFQFLGLESLAAAEAAECAKDQGKFWAMHDAIYAEEGADAQENNGNLSQDKLLQLAGQIGADVAKMRTCLDTGQWRDQVIQDNAQADRYQVSGTPAVFIDGVKYEDNLGYEAMRTFILSKIK